MKNRKIIILLLIGILMLSLVNAVLFLNGGGSVGVADVTLLSPSAEVSSLRIERKGGTPVMLARSSSWRLVEPYPGDVDERVVLKLTDALSQTLVTDSIADSQLLRLGRSRADFELDDPRIRLHVACGEKNSEYLFGALTPSGDGVYVAVGGLNTVFVMPSNLLAAVDVPADGFRRRSLFRESPETVGAFALKRPDGSIMKFTREGEIWKVDGANASADRVRRFLSDVLGSVAVGFVWPVGGTNESKSVSAALLSTYGLDSESALTLTIADVAGDGGMISFGKSASPDEVYALVQRGGAIVTVAAKLKELAMRGALEYTDSRLFPVEASSIAALTVVDGETSYSFSRGQSGEWRIETPVSAPADSERVNRLLNRILTLSSSDITASGLAVSLSTNSAPVTVSRDAVLGNLRFDDLRSKEILRIDPVTVKRIVMSSQDKNVKPTAVEYSRERRSWNVGQESSQQGKVDENGVASVLSALNPLRAERIERLKVSASDLALYGLENPRLTVAVDQDIEKSLRRNIMLGNRTENGCFATVGSSDAVFVISDETAGKISGSIVVY